MADKQSRIVSAFMSVNNGDMTTRAASKLYNIPRTTLRDRLSNRFPLHPTAKTTLSTDEEIKFSNWAMNMARAGFGRTRKDFIFNIQSYLNQLQEPCLRFKNDNKPGKTWYYDFLKRHPELTERSARAIGWERAIVTPARIENWFDSLKAYIETTDPTLFNEPSRLYNCDESGFSLSLKSKKVLAPKSKKGDKHLYLNTISSKQQITTLCCMSATGHFNQPMIVMPGKRLTVNPAKSFAKCAVGLSLKGWMTADLFVNWLEKVFIPELDEMMVRRPVILFLDGSSTHKSLKASDICLKNGVILYCLQANATHLLQPLDLSFFGSLKHHWGEAVMNFQLKNPGMHVTKVTFGLVFKTAYEKACRSEVTRAGFKTAGLFPLSKHAVLNSKKMMAPGILAGTLPTSSSSSLLQSSSSSMLPPPTSSSPTSISSSMLPPPTSSQPPPPPSPLPPPTSSAMLPPPISSSPPQPKSPLPPPISSAMLPPPTSSSPSTPLPPPPPQSNHPTLPSSSFHSVPSTVQKLHVLESFMSEDVRLQYEKRMEEGYDLTSDLMYNAWKDCKLALSSITLYSTPMSSLTCPSIELPAVTTSSTSPTNSDSTFFLETSHCVSAAPSTTVASISEPSTSASAMKSDSLSPDRCMDLETFLSSSTPRAPEKKRIRREFLPNMVLTSEECLAYFAEQEEAEEEGRKKKERQRIREEKRAMREMNKEDKMRQEKEKTQDKGNKGVGGKRKRQRPREAVNDELCGNKIGKLSNLNEIQCFSCKGLFQLREASKWVGCNQCIRWYHKRCVTLIDEASYICDVCL